MSIMTDPQAPHRAADPHTPLETRLMRAALDAKDLHQPNDARLLELVPDLPDRAACNAPVDPEVRIAIERITGTQLPPLSECNAPRARVALKRWAVRWNTYMAT